MTIEIQVGGQNYSQFESATVSLRLDALSNSFSFKATSEGDLPLPFVGGEACKIIVDGASVLNGYIEMVNVEYSSKSHSINISGRDKTADLLDSNLNSISDISAPVTLKQIIERILSEIKLDINVIDNASPEPFNKAEDIISPDPGENAFSFLEKYSRKRQVLLSSNGDGDIVITKSSSDFINSPLRNKINSNENNIINGSVSYDATMRFNRYQFVSSLNASALNFAGPFSIDAVVDQKGSAEDKEIRTSRQFVKKSEESFSDEQNIDRAKWEANIRKTRGRVYSVVVDGYKNMVGDVWGTNKSISVVDDFADINANMLINSVTFNLSVDEGETTTLGLVPTNSYTLSLEEPRAEKVGVGLFG